jgi:PTS system nitrogen regulatory IIA component
MNIHEMLDGSMIIADLKGQTKKQILEELVGHLAGRNAAVQADELLKVLFEREKLGSTGIGSGIAIPHGKLGSLQDIALVFGRSAAGVDFEAIDGKPVHLFFLLVAPAHSSGVHLKALARLSRLLKSADFRQRLMDAPDAAGMHAVIVAEDEKIAV